MTELPQTGESLERPDVALCVDDPALRRFRAALRHFCVGLIDAAAQVRVITPSSQADALSLGSVQTVQHRTPSWPWKRHAVQEVLDALGDRPPSVAHGFSGGAYEVAAEIAAEFNADLVLHVLGIDDLDRLAAIPRERIDWVAVASQPLMDRISSARTLDPDRLSLIRPGVLAGEGATCFSDPERIPTVLCTQRFTAHGGVAALLEAVRILRGHGHEFLVFLTGWGAEEDALRRMVRTHGLTSVVTFANPTGDFRQIMAGADIFVRPAVESSVSIRLLQSLATGTATVALDGGVGDACIPEETALICPDGRPSTLAAAIERLLTNPAWARTLAANGMRHIKKHHSVSAMCRALLDVYHDLALRGRTLMA